MHIVLCEPEIPQNTGNIARTCALTGASLHLVKPFGFSLTDKYMKRAGLDYWDKVKLYIWETLDECMASLPGGTFFYATTRTERLYTQISYPLTSVLVFGGESTGLNKNILAKNPERLIRIPMKNIGRSLNLSNAAAIILFEALRQQGFQCLS